MLLIIFWEKSLQKDREEGEWAYFPLKLKKKIPIRGNKFEMILSY